MTLDECAKVLTKIQLGDNRQADRATLAEWYDSIGMLDFTDAIEAVSIHRRESLDYLQPAHIHKNCARLRAQRAEQQKAVEASRPVAGHPRPLNLDAMQKAHDDHDAIAYAREVGIYDRQLTDAGFPPGVVYEKPWHTHA